MPAGEQDDFSIPRRTGRLRRPNINGREPLTINEAVAARAQMNGV
jgi:hypothetical protein